MNDGCRESGREWGQQRKSRGLQFSQAIAEVAVAQICESEGFQGFQQSALDTLADVTVRYIHNLGTTSHFHANSAGRIESNVFDIVQALEDLGCVQGYTGASNIDHCLANSGTIREIIQYIGEAEKIPFSHSIPKFPIAKDRKPTPSFLQIGEEPPDVHIPAWLPPFPAPNTYVQSSTSTERLQDTQIEENECPIQHRTPEPSLLSFLKRFPCSGSEGSSLFNLETAAQEKQASDRNPFLAAPFQSGDKEVSQVALPARLLNRAYAKTHEVETQLVDNHVSVLEAFTPAIDAMKSSLSNSEEEGQKKVLLNQKPAVQFKIKTGKKPLGTGTTSNLNIHIKDIEKITPWFENDTEEDDKKRRAKRILKESMQNPEDLMQL